MQSYSTTDIRQVFVRCAFWHPFRCHAYYIDEVIYYFTVGKKFKMCISVI